MSMENVKTAIKSVEAKRKALNSLEAKEDAAIAKLKASFDDKILAAQDDLDKALEELDAAYSVIRHGAPVEQEQEQEVQEAI